MVVNHHDVGICWSTTIEYIVLYFSALSLLFHTEEEVVAVVVVDTALDCTIWRAGDKGKRTTSSLNLKTHCSTSTRSERCWAQ
jgi:hypothetical protein